MNISPHTKPGVFIIESLEFEDESSPKEGEMLADILKMSGIESKYFYIRTKDELIELIDQFIESNLRFLHLSFHGNEYSIFTTLHEISYMELGNILKNKLKYRRLFMSACSSANESLADNLFKISGCNSIIGPVNDVYMDEIAIFWASFYHLMFKSNRSAMKKKDLVSTLNKLVKLYDIPCKYYRKSTISPFFKEEDFLIKAPKPNFQDYES